MKTIIKEFKNFSREEQDRAYELWTKHLDAFYNANKDSIKSSYVKEHKELRKNYVKDCVEHGVPITPAESKYLEQ